MVVSRKAVHSALLLALVDDLPGVPLHRAGRAFLGVVQIVVYTGAVMMLFLFVLMLVGVDSSDSLVETLRGPAAGGGRSPARASASLLLDRRSAARRSAAAVGLDAANAARRRQRPGHRALIFTQLRLGLRGHLGAC